MFLNDIQVQYAILSVLWLQFAWELYLSIRQHILLKNTEKVPSELNNIMSQELFDKARLYSLDKSTFGFVKEIFSIILSTIIVYNGYFYYFWMFATNLSMWDNEIAISCIWLFFINALSTITSLPFTIYYTFVLEEKYGFNKQTAGFFVVDKIKVFVLSQVLSTPIAAFAIYIVKVGGNYFFIWLWLMASVVMLLLLTIYPSCIAPLFDKYTPLPNGELRTSIENLAAELKFPLGDLYVVEGSKRSAHSNAFFTGIFVKRIVLYDTLLANGENTGFTNDQVLAVIAHELGHWKLGHIIKNLIMMQVNLLLTFGVFSMMFHYSPLYQALGFPLGLEPVLIGLIAVLQFVLAPYNVVVSFLQSVMSRSFEFQADAFAASLGKSEHLITGLIQLHKDNLSFPVYDPLYSAWHLSHPPLLERISAMKSKTN